MAILSQLTCEKDWFINYLRREAIKKVRRNAEFVQKISKDRGAQPHNNRQARRKGR